ncbi:hypothetical protein HY486_02785 [Candidatus Woesearchaeota archaeon]|nr:hypothetical protein [Candidatus Woesearchaeota archaeon]
MKADTQAFHIIIAIIILGVIAIVIITQTLSGGSKFNLALQCKTQGGTCMPYEQCRDEGTPTGMVCEEKVNPDVCCIIR